MDRAYFGDPRHPVIVHFRGQFETASGSGLAAGASF
jgi:hypothetical protein